MKQLLVVLLAVACSTSGTYAGETNTLADSEVRGRELVQQILQQRPDQNSTITGVLRTRKKSDVPVKLEVVIDGDSWRAIYQTEPGTNGSPAQKLVVTHKGAETNRYELNGAGISADNAFVPFAGSEFWIADLGLEFLHWPGQKILKRELRRSRDCSVLESINSAPSSQSYTRVVSWIDRETDGIVHAEAYIGEKRLKTFDPKEFKKVNGQWQLQEMQIDNAQTGSRTQLEFNLDSK